MEFLKQNYKTILKYTFLFFLFLIWNMIIQGVNTDELWNYGFSYSIFRGEIPYHDFNMVITPFSPFLFSLPFFIFGHNILVFHIENALLLLVLCVFLFKLVNKRAWYLILFLFFPLSLLYPSYNLLLLLLFVILIYCEENNKSDYLIGFILALAILTKQSVGICLLLPSLYYYKKKDKLFKRFIGFIIPILVFLLYILFTNSFKQFLDLCFFGLFDFADQNGRAFNIFYLITLIMVLGTVYYIKKNPKNLKSYYALMFYSIILPMFDMYHVQIAFVVFLLLILLNYHKEIKINPMIITITSVIGISLITMLDGRYFTNEVIYPNDINHFEYRFIHKENLKLTKEINQFIKKNNDKKIVFLDYNAYYVRIINDMPISYLDLINEGNWGYQGSRKLINEIKKQKNTLFIIDKEELENHQTDKKAIKYVMKHGKKVDKLRFYDVYVLN